MALIDELGDRMKHNYEDTAKIRLVRRMPVLKDSDRFYVDRLLGVNDK